MKSLEELRAIKAAAQSRLGIRNDDAAEVRVIVGMGTCGIAAGARAVLNAFTEEVARHSLKNVAISQTGCCGDCTAEPVVEVCIGDREAVTYIHMTPEKAARVVNEHIVGGNAVSEYTAGAATK